MGTESIKNYCPTEAQVAAHLGIVNARFALCQEVLKKYAGKKKIAPTKEMQEEIITVPQPNSYRGKTNKKTTSAPIQKGLF